MCECLLEGYGEADTPERDISVQVRATYKMGTEPVDPNGCTPRVSAAAELRTVWVEEDEV